MGSSAASPAPPPFPRAMLKFKNLTETTLRWLCLRREKTQAATMAS